MDYIAAFGEIAKFFNNVFVSPRNQIKKVVRIYDAMHMILDETNVQRFIVFKAHNSGGVIKPSCELFVSALYEDYTDPFDSVKAVYQHLPLDSSYVKMLVDVIQNKKVAFTTSEMSEGLLKQIYTEEGVVRSFVYFLGNDRKNIYFCSAATSEEHITNKIIVDLGVNIIKQNIK